MSDGRVHGPGSDDKALVNFASAAAKADFGSVTKELEPSSASARAEATSASTLPGSAASARSKKLRACATLSGVQPSIEPSQALKIEVHRVGVRRPFRASRLGDDELGVERTRQAGDDFVLHVEEIGERLVEPLGPEMTAGLGVDELHVDAHAVSAALNAALEDIADVQLAPDLLQIDGLALVSEGGVAPDHERAANARKIGRQALRDPVDEMLLLRVAADIGERQDDDREARRRLLSGSDADGAGAALSEPVLTA